MCTPVVGMMAISATMSHSLRQMMWICCVVRCPGGMTQYRGTSRKLQLYHSRQLHRKGGSDPR